MSRTYRQGDIYYADLSPCSGSEQGGNRPVIILQSNYINPNSPIVTIAPISSNLKSMHLPTHIQLNDGVLTKPSVILLEQIKSIDKCRLRNYRGRANQATLQAVHEALLHHLSLCDAG